MNNLIILVSNMIQLKGLKSKFEKEFEMNDFKKLHYCLEIKFEINREAHTFT